MAAGFPGLSNWIRHIAVLMVFAVFTVWWTWPLIGHLDSALPGAGGDNYSFVWNVWWLRHVRADPALSYYHSAFLFAPFGFNLVNHPHTALPAWVAATVLGPLSPVAAQNTLLLAYVFLNQAVMYALAWSLTHRHLASMVAAAIFGLAPYLSVHLLGHFDLVAAWPLPLLALALIQAERRPLLATVAAGCTLAATAYIAYYYVVFLSAFSLIYLAFALEVVTITRVPGALSIGQRRWRAVAAGLALCGAAAAAMIVFTGGGAWNVSGVRVSARTPQNALSAMWLGILAWMAIGWWPRSRWKWNPPQIRLALRILAGMALTFVVLASPLLWQAMQVAQRGDYVTQTYHWRSTAPGVDLVAPLLGHPLHPLMTDLSQRAYAAMGRDFIEVVGWVGVTPLILLGLAWKRGMTTPTLRAWWVVAIAFAIWSLGPIVTLAGVDTGLRMPAILLRFVPLVDNARMPGRAMSVVFMAIAVLAATSLASSRGRWRSAGVQILLVALVAFEFWTGAVPITLVDRPQVYQALAKAEAGAVCEVPFGVGDGLGAGMGSQDRRALLYATQHGHPLVGGYVGRMPPGAAERYAQMPVVGTLLALSAGTPPIDGPTTGVSPCRYLVVHRQQSSPALLEYVNQLKPELLGTFGDDELYRMEQE